MIDLQMETQREGATSSQAIPAGGEWGGEGGCTEKQKQKSPPTEISLCLGRYRKVTPICAAKMPSVTP